MSDTLYVNNLMFDEAYYLEQNPDVAAVVAAEAAAGNVYTGAQHYYTYGANEGRAPNPWFDADFYQTINEDLKDMDANILLYHFSAYGAGEDRAPNAEIGDGEARLDGNLYLEYVLANADLMEAFNVDEGAEALTPEQNKWAADHFFNYGINEDRKGGIADVVADEKGDSDLESALQDYQVALADHAAAVEAEQDAAAAAVKGLKLDIVADDETGLFDIEEVTTAVKDKVEAREESVREKAGKYLADDVEINETSIAFANQIMADIEEVALNQVAAFKAKDAATVNLQEKVKAYDNTSKAINVNNAEYQAAQQTLNINNKEVSVVNVANYDDAKSFKVSVAVSDKGVNGTVELSFDKNGNLEVNSFSNADASKISAAQSALDTAKADLKSAENDFKTDTANYEAAQKVAGTTIEATDADYLEDGWNGESIGQLVNGLEGLVTNLEKLGGTSAPTDVNSAITGLKDLFEGGDAAYDTTSPHVLDAADASAVNAAIEAAVDAAVAVEVAALQASAITKTFKNVADTEIGTWGVAGSEVADALIELKGELADAGIDTAEIDALFDGGDAVAGKAIDSDAAAVNLAVANAKTATAAKQVEAQNLVNAAAGITDSDVIADAWVVDNTLSPEGAASLEGQLKALYEDLVTAGNQAAADTLADAVFSNADAENSNEFKVKPVIEESALNGAVTAAVDAVTVPDEPTDAEIVAAKEAVTAAQTALDKAYADAKSPEGVEDIYSDLEGVEAFEAAVETLYGNIAAQAAAAASVDAAMLNALKSSGYKVYTGSKAEDTLKVVAWSKVKIEDGKLVRADDEDTTVYTLKGLDSKGKELTYGKNDIPYSDVTLETQLVNLPEMDEFGNIWGEASLGNLPNVLWNSATKSQEAIDDLKEIQDQIEDFNKAVADYQKAADAQDAIEQAADDVETAAEAVAEAEEAFGDLGFNLVKADSTGIATGKVDNEDDADLFVYGESKLTVENFDGNDKLYFGDKAQDIVELAAGFDVTKGNLGGSKDVLDIFVQQVGNDTILYVEKEAYAGNVNANVADNNDIVEIKLAGVNAADVYFEDGFIALA